jgi:hypothetical protein
LLLVNIFNRAQDLEEKDASIPSDEIQRAIRLNLLIIRTYDLLNLLDLYQKGEVDSATSTNNSGVVGNSTNGNGVVANGGNNGVFATGTNNNGVFAKGNNNGVVGEGNNVGVAGTGTNGYGGDFQGGLVPLRPSTTAGSPTTAAHQMGELYVDVNGVLYFCTANGRPGTWKTVQLV